MLGSAPWVCADRCPAWKPELAALPLAAEAHRLAEAALLAVPGLDLPAANTWSGYRRGEAW
eukprot:1147533-Pelagomonas_calceolata.AAC.8